MLTKIFCARASISARPLTIVASCFLVAAALGGTPPPPGFYHVGDLPGGATGSVITSISGDGSTAVGYSFSDGHEQAARWTFQGGLQGLAGIGASTDELYPAEAHGVSYDGSVIVGAGNGPSFSIFGYRWTQQTGAKNLGAPAGNTNSIATNVSADGSTVVGVARGPNVQQGFRWTESSGMIGMGHLAGSEAQSEAYATSGDGSVVVGYSFTSGAGWVATKWTSGLHSLGGNDSYAYDITADAKTIVGTVDDDLTGYSQAVRWVNGGKYQYLQTPSYTSLSVAESVSADGSVIVGTFRNYPGQNDAFIWTPSNGLQLLTPLLASFGVDLTGWRLNEATDVSADGRVIVGTGYNPDGVREGWVVVIPSPGATTALSLFAIGLGKRQRRRAS